MKWECEMGKCEMELCEMELCEMGIMWNGVYSGEGGGGQPPLNLR